MVQVHDTEREIAAYSAAVVRLKAAAAEPLSDSDLAAQLAAAEAEVGAERRRAQQLEAELAAVAAEQAGAAAASAELNALEERYWHEHNEYQLLLAAHIEERDGLLAKIDRASHLLQALSHTNVYNDVFKIWHDGPFGTISGFRLGRTPEVR